VRYISRPLIISALRYYFRRSRGYRAGLLRGLGCSDRARAASARLMMFLAMPCSRVSGYCSKKLSVTVTSSNQRACDFSSPVRWFNAAKSCALRWQPEPAKTSAESSANSPVQGQPGVKSLGSFTSNAGAPGDPGERESAITSRAQPTVHLRPSQPDELLVQSCPRAIGILSLLGFGILVIVTSGNGRAARRRPGSLRSFQIPRQSALRGKGSACPFQP
jgi:hypothetical protein